MAAGARSPVGGLHGRQAELLAALASLAALQGGWLIGWFFTSGRKSCSPR